MALTAALPLVACVGDDPCTHADGNGDGKCDKCGEAVTIQCAQHIDADNDKKCDNCGTDITNVPEGQTNYTVSVKTAGGMPLVGVSVFIYKADGGIATLPQSTNEAGNASFTLETATGYTVYLDGVPEGYNVLDGKTAETRYPMQTTGAQIILSSKPISEGGLKANYNVGDIMYDFAITDIDGNTYKLSELLATKRMVMLNFWYVDCSWCNKEFPGLNDAYANYNDKLEVLAINDYASDTAVEVKEFPITGTYADDNLTFPFFKVTDEKGLLIGKFGGFGAGNTGYPTTVIIDRYGLICMIEQGAIVGESKWNKIFDHFTADDYEQKLVYDAADLTPPEIPDIEWGGSDGISANLSAGTDLVTGYRPDDDQYSWPFIPGEKSGIKYVEPSNKSDNSYGIIYADIQLKPGQAVMLDYFASCEYGNDRLVVIVDGNDICSLTGLNDGDFSKTEDWEQCCAFVDPRPITEANKNELATYELAFAYIKDTEISEGDDTIYLKDLRTIGVNEIEIETYIIREAVSGPTADNSGFNAYVEYILGDDGYYHVKDQNGNAGPLLLVNMLGYTNFDSYKTVSQRIMDAGEILVNNVDKYNIWMVYGNASSNSAMYGFSPVTKELKDILDAYCKYYMNDVGKDSHKDLWLQLCSYYDAYGKDENGNPTKHVEDPIRGLTTFSAFETDFKADPAVGDKETFEVTYDRVIMPRGYLYKFSPKTSGVYRITSHSKEEMNAWIFTGSSYEWIVKEDGERDVLANFEEEERFCPVLNIKNDDGTFTRDTNNVSLVAYLEAGKDYYIDIAYYDIYAEGTFTFDITYEAESLDVFVMASPGPITYLETAGGSIGGLIALGIDYGFKADTEGGVKYAYQVLARDENGNVTKWGEKIYADFYYPTIPFSSQSIKTLYEKTNAFNFTTVSEKDMQALAFLEKIREDGKAAIIAKWTANGVSNAAELWATKGLDNLIKTVQSGASATGFSSEDIATAKEAIKLGTDALKAEWGADAETNWNTTYKMDEVAKGIYHGKGTEAIAKYIALMDNDPLRIERQGCVAVTEELSIILSDLYSAHVFENVKHDWLKFCFYYKYLGPETN